MKAKTAVFLTETECALFILLAKAKALEVKEGSVEIFFTQSTPVKVKVSEFTTTNLSPPVSIDRISVVI